jgi:hypothetical protein
MQPHFNGMVDSFVLKLDPSGMKFLFVLLVVTKNEGKPQFSSYFGGARVDTGNAIGVDKAGNTFVSGWTRSNNLVTKDALQTELKGASDAFILAIDQSGNSFILSFSHSLIRLVLTFVMLAFIMKLLVFNVQT